MTPDAATIRAGLDHPVVDADGHVIEFLPIVAEYVGEVGGHDLAERFRGRMAERARMVRETAPGRPRRDAGLFRTGVWVLPTENTRDRATAMLPALGYERLDELGIDFALLYPTYGIGVINMIDDELRPVVARALNHYYVDAFAGFRDRLEPVAVIPTVRPDEAIAELDHAVGELGLKAVMMAGIVPRPLPGWESSRSSFWLDTLGHDSEYDYDPLWARCADLGVVPTFHAGGQGWGTRMSTTNNAYNQIGNFATAGEAVCRSLLFGGVPKRFPTLPFAFLEGGVTWAWQLLSDVRHSYEKRNRAVMHRYDPANIDRALFGQLVDRYGRGRLEQARAHGAEWLEGVSDYHTVDVPDDYAESGLTGDDDIRDVFERQLFFGCEADDPGTALAFSDDGSRCLNPMFASDSGHWDVPDMRGMLPEAWEFVEEGRLDGAQFREFVFGNVTRMLTTANPAFFDGTMLEKAVRAMEVSS